MSVDYDVWCPNCGDDRPQRIDDESVECPLCGWVTDWYEARKAWEKMQEIIGGS